MSEIVKVVGTIKLGGQELDVYSSLDEPVFKAADIATMLDYSAGNVWNLVKVCEPEDIKEFQIISGGQRRTVTFVTRMGLYDIICECRRNHLTKPMLRDINDELINLRKSRGLNIVEQFKEWDKSWN